MKLFYYILLTMFCLSVYARFEDEDVPHTNYQFHKKLKHSYHAFEFDNLRLYLKPFEKKLAKISTPHKRFAAPCKKKKCMRHPDLEMYALSYNKTSYIEFLKGENGTQFYVGKQNVQLLNNSNFTSILFYDGENKYYCGVKHEYCDNSLMFFRCLLTLFS